MKALASRKSFLIYAVISLLAVRYIEYARPSPTYGKVYLSFAAAHADTKNQAALKYYLKAAHYDPRNPKAYDELGKIYGSLGQTEKKITYFKKAVEHDSHDAPAYLEVAKDYDQKSATGPAIELLKKALRLDPSFHEARYYLGHIYFHHGQREKALEQLATMKNLIERDHETTYWQDRLHETIEHYYLQGKNLQDQGRIKESIELFKLAIAQDTGYPDAYFNMGLDYFRKANFEQATEYFQKAVGKNLSYYEARYYLGLTYHRLANQKKAQQQLKDMAGRMDQMKEATPYYQKLMKVIEPYYYLATVYGQKGQKNLMMQFLKLAADEETSFPEAYRLVGDDLIKKNQLADAAKYYQGAVALQPDWFDVHYQLGLIYLKLGDDLQVEDRIREMTHYSKRYGHTPLLEKLQQAVHKAKAAEHQ